MIFVGTGWLEGHGKTNDTLAGVGISALMVLDACEQDMLSRQKASLLIDL